MSKKSPPKTRSDSSAPPSKGGQSLVYLDDKTLPKLKTEIQKSKIIIPTELSKKTNINVSILRKYLQKLVEKGELELINKGPRLEVFLNKKLSEGKTEKKK